MIAVSAIDSGNAIAPFSSIGKELSCAPGVNVLSTIPGGGYGTKSGTSMTCPHVSDAAALTWGGHRFADNEMIRKLLNWGSYNLGIPGPDEQFGLWTAISNGRPVRDTACLRPVQTHYDPACHLLPSTQREK